jgi:hypothetical protein
MFHAGIGKNINLNVLFFVVLKLWRAIINKKYGFCFNWKGACNQIYFPLFIYNHILSYQYNLLIFRIFSILVFFVDYSLRYSEITLKTTPETRCISLIQIIFYLIVFCDFFFSLDVVNSYQWSYLWFEYD